MLWASKVAGVPISTILKLPTWVLTTQFQYVSSSYYILAHTGTTYQSSNLPLLLDSNIHLCVGSEMLELPHLSFLQMALQFYMFQTYLINHIALLKMMVYPLNVQFVVMQFVPKLLVVEMVNMVETTLVLCLKTKISPFVIHVVILDFQAIEPIMQVQGSSNYGSLFATYYEG